MRGAGSRIVALTLSALLSSCSERPETGTEAGAELAGPLTVYVVNYPLAYFAQRVAGDRANVVFPAPPGVDPAFWSAPAETVAAYQDADLILLNGAGYARWLQHASLPRAKLVDTSVAFREQYIATEEGITHGHGPGGAHSHAGTAFTTWLDPALAEEQARAALEAFATARPGERARFEAGFAALRDDLRRLDEQLAASAQRIGDAPLLFSHPVYPYLARRYELNGRSLDWEPDVPPDERRWRQLDALLESHGARWMLWESEPLASTADALRARGVESLVYDPCANVPNEGDFLAVMDANAQALRAIAEAPSG